MSYQLIPIANQVVFRQGDEGSEFFIILSGSVNVSIADSVSGYDTTVATLYSGDSFGELALIQTNCKRAATVTCR